MARATWTCTAREDLKQIGRYIGRREGRPSVAAKILREIRAKCDSYSEAFARGPVLGSDAAELGVGCRVFPHKRWVIVFEAAQGGSGILVLRVLDGSRDFGRLFGQS